MCNVTGGTADSTLEDEPVQCQGHVSACVSAPCPVDRDYAATDVDEQPRSWTYVYSRLCVSRLSVRSKRPCWNACAKTFSFLRNKSALWSAAALQPRSIWREHSSHAILELQPQEPPYSHVQLVHVSSILSRGSTGKGMGFDLCLALLRAVNILLLEGQWPATLTRNLVNHQPTVGFPKGLEASRVWLFLFHKDLDRVLKPQRLSNCRVI